MTDTASPSLAPAPSPSLAPPPAPAPGASGSPASPGIPIATPATPAAPATPATAPAERPAWLPETFQDPAAFRASYDELAAFKAGQDVRRSTLPASPNDYKTEFTSDFKIPDGIKYEFNANDPLLHQ